MPRSNFIFALLMFISLSAQGAAPFEVLGFSPEGTVKDVRQVRASFSEAMIAFGDPRAADPFDITCAPAGHGRWADTKNWVFDFDQNLPAGVQCSFQLKAGLRSIGGGAVTGRSRFGFDTGGPAVKRTEPWEGAEVDEEQIFVLRLDAEPDPKSVLQNAYFTVGGIQEKIPLKLIEKDPRKDPESSKVKLFAHKFGLPTRVGTKHAAQAEIYVQATRRFPPEADIQLIWGAGITTANGAATKEAQTLPFKVRPEFSAKLSCERENAEAACLPILPLSVNFNAEVPWGLAREIRLRGPNGKEWKPATEKSEKRRDDDGVRMVRFDGPFPEKTSFQITVPSGLHDDAGRALANASRFPLAVATAEAPPLLKFPSEFGILELKPEAILPVTVRNLEATLKGQIENVHPAPESIGGKVLRLGTGSFQQTIGWLAKIGQAKRDASVFAETPKTEPLAIPKPAGERPMEVIGIPLKKAGFYVVEFQSERLGASLLGMKAPMFVPTTALVTNLSVHFKQGRESSLVWVTSLDQGRPVEGATVSIRDCEGAVLFSGSTDAHGIARIAKTLPGPYERRCSNLGDSAYATGLYAVAESGDDFSFVHTSWQKGIESWRYNLPGPYALTPEYASTVFDRTLFRAGETVHMKHFFRHHSTRGIELADRERLPRAVQIRHQESDQSFVIPLTWREHGLSESTWSIPKSAKLGVYTVTLIANDGSGKTARRHHGENDAWPSGEFRVEEYRVPLMRGQIQPPKNDLVGLKSVPFDVSVEYLSGGAAARLPVQIRHQTTTAGPISFPAFDGFSFGTGRVKARESSEEEAPDEIDLDAPTPESTSGGTGASPARKLSLTLDNAGTGHVDIPVSPAEQIKNLQVELDYRDPNGETQTVAREVALHPSARLIGVRPASWFSSKDSLKFQVAVTDLHGNPVKNAPVDVEFVERKTYSHRKRLVGGFYAYEHKSELKRHGRACKGSTDEKGLLDCDTKPPVSGNLVLEAKTADEQGRVAFGSTSTWIYDSEEWWFAQDDSDRIDLLPERKRYESGEKAVFQVRMPFREATALVTVEREGILDSFVVPLSGKKPLIEVPIKPNYAPNVFVSALVIRGRVGDVQPTALVDLGRPSYKLGLSEIHVGQRPFELNVQVQPSKEVFQVRERGVFKVRVKTAAGGPLPKGSEIALAAIDEGLLQLKPNESWNLLDAMMRARGYEVQTSTAQTEVVGKRHFGLKALPPGGDGGKAPSREIFDSLLYWNPKVTLDSNGEGEVSFPMNDSVTGFKIAAVASAGDALFGTGFAKIRTTQDLMILSGVPPLAREGDQMKLVWTLRNTTAKPMSIQIAGKASGLTDFAPPDLALAPGEAKQIEWSVAIPHDVSSLRYELSAKDKLGSASDHIQITQKIVPAVPVRIFQATLEQLDGKTQMPIEKPMDAIAGRGGIRVVLDSTLLTGLDGVRAYMGDYPYACLEQRASKAVALRDPKLWKAVVDDLPNYLDGDGLARYFPSDWIRGSDILTSYLLAVSHDAGWDFPEEPRGRMLDGLKRFIEGRVTRISDLPTADLTVRKVAALSALSRYGLAKWSLTGSMQITPNLWPTSALIDWQDALKRMPDVPDPAAKLAAVDQMLRSRLNFQGTTMGFSTENTDELWWMMVSTSVNANRFLLSVVDQPAWKNDIARVARGVLGRQRRGHWDTTTANAWGVLALERFSQLFEKTPVGGTTTAKLGPERSLDWKAHPHGGALDFEWPQAKAALALAHSGSGRPWVTVQSLAAIPLKASLSSGYRIKKTWSAVEQKKSGQWSKGDIARVHLELESQSDMTWVVVNDPIPAGAVILGSGLGGDSSVASSGEKSRGWAEPAFQERAFEGYRAYYQFVPKGKWSLEYTVRFNQSGQMSMPATRVEAMYAPEMFGENPNAPISIAD